MESMRNRSGSTRKDTLPDRRPARHSPATVQWQELFAAKTRVSAGQSYDGTSPICAGCRRRRKGAFRKRQNPDCLLMHRPDARVRSGSAHLHHGNKMSPLPLTRKRSRFPDLPKMQTEHQQNTLFPARQDRWIFLMQIDGPCHRRW